MSPPHHDNNNYKRIQRARTNKKWKLRSRLIKYDRTNKKYYNDLRAACIRIWRDCCEDLLKAPGSCPVNPAWTSKPSFNVYLGQDLDDQGQTVLRTAYAVGSGASSIGLDPKALKIYSIQKHREVQVLLDHANRFLKDEYKGPNMENKFFNFVSVKIYLTFRDKNGKLVRKTTEWHVDVTHNHSTREAMPNNSQEPNTPVLIWTFGDDKELVYRRGYSSKKAHRKSKELYFLQNCGSMFLMEGLDEVPSDDGTCWYHMSRPLNTGNEKMEKEGITWSFQFRRVAASVLVNKSDNKLANPKETPKKTPMFDNNQHLMETEHYTQLAEDRQQNMNTFLHQTYSEK